LTMARLKDISGEIIFVFGRQDDHVPPAGRAAIKNALDDAGVNYGWIEVNAQHAFIRDEMSKGRYDPALTRCCMTFALDLFHRVLTLGCGDCRGVTGSSMGPANC